MSVLDIEANGLQSVTTDEFRADWPDWDSAYQCARLRGLPDFDGTQQIGQTTTQ